MKSIALDQQPTSLGGAASKPIRRWAIRGCIVIGTLLVNPPQSRSCSLGYEVFFAEDSSEITEGGKRIIQLYADPNPNYLCGRRWSNLEIVGHTDYPGSSAYNLKLSYERANAVRLEFMRLGVPLERMSVTARGARLLKIPTERAEIQNRRVEILLR